LYPSQEEYERLGTDAYAVLAGDKAYRTEMLMRRKDGTNVTISLSGKAIDATRPQAGSIWIFEDNTERINARLQLQEKNRQLEFLTGDLEKKVEKEVALRAKGEQILFQQSKLAAMGEMLGAISHQWRQPLNALGIIIQNIRESSAFGELDQEQVEHSVRKSMAQIQHMSKTIDDFRNFFRLDKRKVSFDPVQTIADALYFVRAIVSQRDQLSVDMPCL